MITRLARLVLALYPLGFRRRYGDELDALLEQRPPGLRALADLLVGAVRAHLRPTASANRTVGPGDRVRLSSGGILLCWVLFAAAGFSYYKTTEDRPFALAGHDHPLLAAAHLVVQAAAVIGSAAVVLGALPLIAIALDRARAEPAVRRHVAQAVGPVIAFAVLTAIAIAIAHAVQSSQPPAGARLVGVLWGLSGLGCGIACAVGCRAALLDVTVASRWLRAALAWGTVVTAAMVVVGIATGVYAIALIVSVPDLAAGANGPLQLASTGGSLVIQACLMGALGVGAAIAARRGWSAWSAVQ